MAFAPGSAENPDNAAADRLMVEHWTELCFNTGGAEDGLFLDAAKVKRAGGTAKIVGDALGIGPQDLRPLMDGVVPITAEQLSTVTQRLGVEIDSLVGADPLADVVIELAWPVFKREIVARTTETGIGEAAVRAAARREFALAARNDSDALRDTKLRDAIRRAGREAN